MNVDSKKTRWLKVVVISGLLAGGCTMVYKSEAMKMERTLTAAGFQMKPAGTKKKIEQLSSLTQRKLIRQEQKGGLYYLYADAVYCKCLYTGTEEAYQRYRKLAQQQKLQEDKIEAAGQDEAMPINWDPMGDWYQGN